MEVKNSDTQQRNQMNATRIYRFHRVQEPLFLEPVGAHGPSAAPPVARDFKQKLTALKNQAQIALLPVYMARAYTG